MSDQAVESSNYLDDDFKEWVQLLLDKHHIPGISIAVIDGDKINATGIGLARLPDIPATADTVYLMASTSKAITAATMGMIIHDEKNRSRKSSERVNWSTPIVKILPDDFMLSDPYISNNTTIEDALSHRSGFPGHDNLYGPWAGRTPEAWTQRLRTLGPITAPFRVKFQYNNLMYGVVSHVAEKLEGQPFAAIIKNRVFNPLGMDSTYFRILDAERAVKASKVDQSRFARGYHWLEEKATDAKESAAKSSKGWYLPEPHLDLVGLEAAGGIASTVTDYAKWVTALLKAAKKPKDEKDSEAKIEKPFISHELFTELTTPRTTVLPAISSSPEYNPLPELAHLTPLEYCLGWTVDQNLFPGQAIVEHGGGFPGFGTLVSLVPRHNFGVVAAANHTSTGNIVCELVRRELVGRKLGVSKEERRKDDGKPKEEKDKSKSEEADKIKTEPAKSLVQDLSAEAPPGPIELPKAQSTNTHVTSEDVSGRYIHPGYGLFSVSDAASASRTQSDPVLDHLRVIRKEKEEDKKTKPDPKTTETNPLTLQAVPLGPRTLRNAFLLHPRKSVVVPDSQQQKRYEFFDLEKLAIHGNMEDEPVSSFPPGYGREDDAKYPGKKEVIWESFQVLKFGGVFETISEADDNHSRPRVLKMGLRLARSDFPDEKRDNEDEEPADDWERNLMWFEKVDEA